jgi:hypothetical protein
MSFQFSFFGVCGRVNFRNARSCQGFSALVRRTRGPLVDSIHRRYHQQRCSPDPTEQFQNFFMTWSAHHNLQKFIILNVTSGCVSNVRGVSPRVKNRKWSATHLPYSSSVHPPHPQKYPSLNKHIWLRHRNISNPPPLTTQSLIQTPRSALRPSAESTYAPLSAQQRSYPREYIIEDELSWLPSDGRPYRHRTISSRSVTQ